MSIPPQLIRVKRKATEEAPVSYLRVQETKRHRSDDFVYQRQNEEATFAESIPTQTQKPIIHTSAPGRRAQAFQSIQNQNNRPSKDVHAAEGKASDSNDISDNASKASIPTGANVTARTNTDTDTDTDTMSVSGSEPRRFHMSRKDMLAAAPYPGRAHGGVSKRRPAPATFVERKIKRASSRILEKLHAANNDSTVTLAPIQAPLAEAMDVDKPEPRKFKKPGVARLAARDSRAKDSKPELPKSMTDRWNVDMQQLTADMEAYAMQQIGLNLRKAEEEKREQEQARATTPSKLKFRPKPPAKRYAERHPEEAGKLVDKEMRDADVETSDSDDGDYIIETYVRVPASRMGDHVPPQSVGLLVFDEEPDIEYFYGEDDESEDEWAEDEEDENAENYYTADYPDEEVASDDEFNKNAYAFRTDNASDLEEYGFEGQSDDEFDRGNTASQFRTYIGRNGLRTNHL